MAATTGRNSTLPRLKRLDGSWTFRKTRCGQPQNGRGRAGQVRQPRSIQYSHRHIQPHKTLNAGPYNKIWRNVNRPVLHPYSIHSQRATISLTIWSILRQSYCPLTNVESVARLLQDQVQLVWKDSSMVNDLGLLYVGQDKHKLQGRYSNEHWLEERTHCDESTSGLSIRRRVCLICVAGEVSLKKWKSGLDWGQRSTSELLSTVPVMRTDASYADFVPTFR